MNATPSRAHRAVALAVALPLVAPLGCRDGGACVDGAKRRVLREAVEETPRIGGRTRDAVVDALAAAECETGIDSLLLLAVAERESRLDPRARGPAGGLGLLQVRPPTGAAVAERIGLGWRGERTLLDPGSNARIGAAYLAKLRRDHDGWEAALSAYNLGPTGLRRLVDRGLPATSPYARAILKRHRSLRSVLSARDGAS